MIFTVTLNPARDRTVMIPGFKAGKVNRIKETRDDPGRQGHQRFKGDRRAGRNERRDGHSRRAGGTLYPALP